MSESPIGDGDAVTRVIGRNDARASSLVIGSPC